MSTLGVFNTVGGYNEIHWGCHDEWGDIMSATGVFSTQGGYHEYTRRIPK